MLKVAFIGAGSLVFAKNLIIDILSFHELRECTICLMDVDKERLQIITELAKRIIKENNFPTKIEATTSQKRALEKTPNLSIEVLKIQPVFLDELLDKIRMEKSVELLPPGGYDVCSVP